MRRDSRVFPPQNNYFFPTSSLKVEEAKDIHTSLRKAAGLMKFVQDSMIPQLVEKTRDGSDLDIRILSAYLNQVRDLA